MDPFVNLRRRGIDLPQGCKDLMDALLKKKPRHSPQDPMCAQDFADIQRHLSRLLLSQAQERHLVISTHIPPRAIVLEFGPFQLGCCPSGLSALVFVDATEPLLEQQVRTVFEEAGISQFASFGVGGGVEPTRMLRYPLPNAAAEAASLIKDVLQKGLGVTKEARLALNYYERE